MMHEDSVLPRMTRRRRTYLAAYVIGLALSLLTGTDVRADKPRTAAVFDFELIDTSLEGEMRGQQPAEQTRLALISHRLRDLLAQSGRYEPIDIAPAATAIEAAGSLYGCNGCEADIARQLGAELAIRGVVQKVSNLILNMTVYVTESETGRHVTGASVDIRGNTDESWLRGVSYLVRNRLAVDPN